MTCALCQQDSRYDLDISRDRFPFFRRRYDLSLCEDHCAHVIKTLDGMVAEYMLNLVKERIQKRE